MPFISVEDRYTISIVISAMPNRSVGVTEQDDYYLRCGDMACCLNKPDKSIKSIKSLSVGKSIPIKVRLLPQNTEITLLCNAANEINDTEEDDDIDL